MYCGWPQTYFITVNSSFSLSLSYFLSPFRFQLQLRSNTRSPGMFRSPTGRVPPEVFLPQLISTTNPPSPRTTPFITSPRFPTLAAKARTPAKQDAFRYMASVAATVAGTPFSPYMWCACVPPSLPPLPPLLLPPLPPLLPPLPPPPPPSPSAHSRAGKNAFSSCRSTSTQPPWQAARRLSTPTRSGSAGLACVGTRNAKTSFSGTPVPPNT